MDISIITTTYNRKALLKETIESVQRSVLAPLNDAAWEHIIYDDGSTDGTEDLFKNSKWENVVYLRGETNKGQSYGRNEAIRKARGKYIFPVDSDDIILQRTLYNFIRMTREYSKTDWFTTDFLHVNNELAYMSGQDYWGWRFSDCGVMLDAIFQGEHFLQGNVLFKKDLCLRVGGYDELVAMGEDLDLYTRFLLNNALPQHCDFLSHLHRTHGKNISGKITPNIHKVYAKQLQKKYASAQKNLEPAHPEEK